MKKGIFFLLIPLMCLPFYHLAKAIPEGIPLSTYSFKSKQVILSKPIVGEIILLPESSFSEDEVFSMIRNIEKVDQNILMLAARQNIKIKLFNGSLTDQEGLNSLQDKKPRGYTESAPNWDQVPGMSKDRVVYAKIGHSEYGKGHSSVSLELHELAHAIDKYVFYYVRKDPMFLNIWKQEVHQLFPMRNYFIQFPEEYFAESFAMYYHNKETKLQLNEKAPLTFKFIHSLEQKAANQPKIKYVSFQ